MIHKAEVTVIPNKEIYNIFDPITMGVYTLICANNGIDLHELYTQYMHHYNKEVDKALIELMHLELITMTK